MKAENLNKAEKKLRKEVKTREEPYLNAQGQLVRWKFESIEERYHTFIESKNDFDRPVKFFRNLKREN